MYKVNTTFSCDLYSYREDGGNWAIQNVSSNTLQFTPSQLYRLSRLYPLGQDNDALILRINSQCHYKCVHCFIADRDNHHVVVDYDTIINKIENYKEHKVIVITGGEPMFHPQIREILTYCKSHGYIVAMETNLPNFDKPEAAKAFNGLVDVFAIPSYSIYEDVYESVSQIKGSYAKHRAALENVKKYMPHTGFNFVLVMIRPIIKTMYETIGSLIKEYPGSTFFVGASCLTGPSNSTEVSPSFAEIHPELAKVLNEFGEVITTSYTPLCYIYPFIGKMFAEGCSSLVHTGLDLLHNKATDVYYDMSTVTHKPEKCKSCALDYMCSGFVEGYETLYDSEEDALPMLHPDLLPSEKGNCDICGVQLSSEKVEVFTSFEHGEKKQKYKIKRTMCPSCLNSFSKKLAYIGQNI